MLIPPKGLLTFCLTYYYYFSTATEGCSHLARVRLVRLWGQVRLHTCAALCNQGTQVKAAITTHTHTQEEL